LFRSDPARDILIQAIDRPNLWSQPGDLRQHFAKTCSFSVIASVSGKAIQSFPGFRIALQRSRPFGLT
jgi:hypothetical protein